MYDYVIRIIENIIGFLISSIFAGENQSHRLKIKHKYHYLICSRTKQKKKKKNMKKFGVVWLFGSVFFPKRNLLKLFPKLFTFHGSPCMSVLRLFLEFFFLCRIISDTPPLMVYCCRNRIYIGIMSYSNYVNTNV